MSKENPFKGMAYITEKGIAPEAVFKRYSIEPFKYLLKYLDNNNNCFFVGRIGIGKTMVLCLFDPKYQNVLHQNHNNIEYRNQILELIPTNFLSIYVNISDPRLYLTRFSGKNLNETEWLEAFSDYFGNLLLKRLINNIELIKNNDSWQSNLKLNFNSDILDKSAIKFGNQLTHIIPECREIRCWTDLKNYIDSRLNIWIDYITKIRNIEFTTPQNVTDLLQPCIALWNSLKNTLLNENFRLFIIIDQYETLCGHKEIIDFRPIFNLAMQQASRGSSSIEFKIGVRPYGYKDNIDIFRSSSKLDLAKECSEIMIDEIIKDYYKKFINNLTQKCFDQNPELKGKDPKEIFYRMSPVDEVKRYIGRTDTKTKHLKKFFHDVKFKHIYSVNRDSIIQFIVELTNEIYPVKCRIWIQTLLAIIIEKDLQHKNREIVTQSNEIKQNIDNIIKRICRVNLDKCPEKSDKCYCSKKSDKKTGIDQSFRTKIKEIRDAALFLISDSYKHDIKKFYTGYKVIRQVSSRIVLNYIEMLSSIMDEKLLRGEELDMKTNPIIQTKVIEKQSKKRYNNISSLCPNGLGVKMLVRKLGTIFRRKQVETSANSPTPNGFSLKQDIIDLINKIDNPEIIIEALSYGYIEVNVRRRGSTYPKLHTYTFNRILCPYFGISINSFKSPLSILKKQTDFLNDLCNTNLSTKDLYEYFKFQDDDSLPKEQKKLDLWSE
ncbi:MAG: hypothetical protein GF364_00245 [Candidatus Lokiarchaeota archaeon]|nr:hypothetical protein [Candidatus Lokiarchaeota archaeon]